MKWITVHSSSDFKTLYEIPVETRSRARQQGYLMIYEKKRLNENCE